MLQSFYPELSANGYGARIVWDGYYDISVLPRAFTIIVWRTKRLLNTDKGRTPPTRPLPEQKILTASFVFDPQGIIESLRVSAPDVVSDVRADALRKTVDKHRMWTYKQVEQALREAGAKYGPSNRDALLQAMPRDALGRYLGAFQIKSAEFRLRHEQPSGSLAELYWELDVSSTAPDGRILHWSITFEPFGGRLTSIVRHLSDR